VISVPAGEVRAATMSLDSEVPGFYVGVNADGAIQERDISNNIALVGRLLHRIYLPLTMKNPSQHPQPPTTSGTVHITNIRDTTFTVSWITNSPSTGFVRYGTSPDNLNRIAYDVRGGGVSDDTHYVTISGLVPNTTYYFDVHSGSIVDDNHGQHYRVTTGPTLDLRTSDAVYGRVLRTDGRTPAEGTIVYVTLQDADGSGTSGSAAVLSSLVDRNGYWYVDLGNARTSDLSSYFLYSSSGDRLHLEAEGAGDGTAALTVDTGNDSPAPDMVLRTGS